MICSKKICDFTIHCDGGARGNPGPAASAIVVSVGEKVIYTGKKYLGHATNNTAEYNGVILALTWLLTNLTTDNRIKNLEVAKIVLDSELVVKQLRGIYKIKNINLRNYYLICKNVEKKLPLRINYIFVPRYKNKMADLLVNQSLDENTK